MLPYKDEDFLCSDGDFIKQRCEAYYYVKKSVAVGNHLEAKRWKDVFNNNEIKLQDFLTSHLEWNIHTIDDLKLLLRSFYSEDKITSDYYARFQERHINTEYAVDRVYYDNLLKIADSLLTFRDGRIAIKTWVNKDEEDIFDYPHIFNKVEIWNILSRMISADTIIAAYYIKCGWEKMYYLYNQDGNVFMADKSLETLLQKGIAETHVHFNAGHDYMYRWLERMNPELWDRVLVDKESYRVYCGESRANFSVFLFRMLWIQYLIEGAHNGFSEFLRKEYGEYEDVLITLMDGFYSGALEEYRQELKELWISVWFLWRKTYPEKEKNDIDYLLNTIMSKYEYLNTNSEIVLLFLSFLHLKRYCLTEDLHFFLQYVRCKNLFLSRGRHYSNIEGLAFFQKKYRIAAGEFQKEAKDTVQRGKFIFKSLSANPYLKKLEIRITPSLCTVPNPLHFETDASISNTKNKNLNKIRNLLLSFKCAYYGDTPPRDLCDCKNDKDMCQKKIPTLGVVFHFTKKEFLYDRVGNDCWLLQSNGTINQTEHISAYRESMIRTAKVIEEIRSEIPRLGEYLVGIDAASEENTMEPWVFAPVYREIRRKGVTKPVVHYGENGTLKRLQNIGFTYHVGEEFRHLLSGLRHIDEVITHFHYKAGDRLGHAIALGVDVEHWINRNEAVTIPRLEHLENLLWMWGNLVYREWGLEINVEALEGKILEHAKSIYDNISGMTVFMLYDAYKAKFSKKEYLKRINRIKRSGLVNEEFEDNPTNDMFCRFFESERNGPCGWNSDMIFCTYFCPIYNRKFLEPIIVPVNKRELGMLRIIQNNLISDIEKRGIFIEVNPTSNLAIGEIDGLFSLHVFNLNSKGLSDDRDNEREVLLTINSDDPMVFSTNTENELAYVYHALNHMGKNQESVLNWIDKVRRMGMDSSFVRKLKTAKEQLEDIEIIISEIEHRIHES